MDLVGDLDRYRLLQSLGNLWYPVMARVLVVRLALILRASIVDPVGHF
jgi:hypothetical protein